MAGNIIVTNANGKMVTLQNPDTNNDDVVVDASKIVSQVGDQTIAGVKTFSSSPIVPTPITDTQAANKKYVDSIIPNIQSLPIGTILNAYTIFDNCIVAFGGEFNRADYPKLWAYLQANSSLVKTQAQWQTEATANGGICGFFSSGNETTTFRVPSLSGATAKFTNRGVGSYEADQVKQHRHTYTTFTTEKVAGGANTVSNEQTTTGYTSYFGGVENTVRNTAFLPLIVAK